MEHKFRPGIFIYNPCPGTVGNADLVFSGAKNRTGQGSDLSFPKSIFWSTGCCAYSLGTTVHEGRYWSNHHHGWDSLGPVEPKKDSKSRLTVTELCLNTKEANAEF